MLKAIKNKSYRGDNTLKVYRADDPHKNNICNIRKVKGFYENDRFSMYPLYPTIKQTLEKLETFIH